MEQNNQVAQKALADCLGCTPDNLPALPPLAAKLTQIFNDQDISVSKVAGVLAKDPSLTAMILKIANSPFYGAVEPVIDLGRAITILGLQEVQNLALGLTFLRSAGGTQPLKSRMLQTTLWQHSIACGILSELLAKDFLGMGRGYYSLGLLHDLGKLALLTHRPRDYKLVLELTQKKGMSFDQAENLVFQFNHSLVSGLLLASWDMPDQIVDAVAYHHAPWDADEHEKAAGLVFLANYLAHAVGHTSYLGGGEEDPSLQIPPRAFDYLSDTFKPPHELLQAGVAERIAKMKDFIENF